MAENLMKVICCTCLSKDRKLFQLCRIRDAVNNFLWLLSYDRDSNSASFHKDPTSMYICWECRALMDRVVHFRQQVCTAQKKLITIADGWTDMKSTPLSLSRLSLHHIIDYEAVISKTDQNFVDCGSDDIKIESDDDLPLSELNLLSQERDVKSVKRGKKSRFKRQQGDKKTRLQCAECDMSFDNKNQRWKHVQRTHREGYQCSACDKRFAFKNNLVRHEMLHTSPPPREECPTCHKQVRVDLWKAHARSHGPREAFTCRECDKRFVSRASYEHHLKYTQTHAVGDLLKHKCPSCNKGYRSKAELRDHVNYQHVGKSQHICPECGKALATPRCVTRHVRRAHRGIKENAKDKICQQCGKAFRDAKGLREHEWIHSGERPLACEHCSRTFRQSAALYAHTRRVHSVATRIEA